MASGYVFHYSHAMFQIELIKRANNLWTNDSLFLRDYLRIPVPFSGLQQQSLIGPLISHEQLPCLPSDFSKVPFSQNREKLQRSQMTDASTTVALVASAEDDLNQVDVGKYFTKYDSLIVRLKNSASERESNSRYECLF